MNAPGDGPPRPPSGTADAHDRDVAARRRAVVLAGHRGDAATARAGLGDADPGVRESSLGALERIGCLSTGELVAALGDPAAAVRRRAALVAAGREDAGDALALLLDDEDRSVVETAAFAWGERRGVPPGVVGRLSELATGHDDHLCREAAVAALGAVGDPAGLPAVLAGCSDRHTVRRRAVLALAAFDGPEVTEALRRLIGDRDLQVRQAAEELLAIEEGSAAGPADHTDHTGPPPEG